jgi:hypothetical protein
VINNAAGASGATTLTIGPYQQGDCSTTFNLPNYTGKFLAGVDGFTNITAAGCNNAASIGDKTVVPSSQCGQQTTTLTSANLPAYTPSGTITVNTSTINYNAYVRSASASGSTQPNSLLVGTSTDVSAGSITSNGTFSATASFSGSAQGGTSTSFTNLPPASLVYKIIKT